MKLITSAVIGLTMTLAAFAAQAPASTTPAPAAKDNAMAATPAKKHVKKHVSAKKPATTATAPAASTTPAK